MGVYVTYDETLVEEIAARFDLREPNRLALDEIVRRIAARTDGYEEMVADLATGVGKTFLMSALIDYLALQGVRHVLVVTPGSTIQNKTLANFDAASAKYVAGADIVPFVVTPDNFRTANVGAVLRDPNRLKVFVFNVQQLIRPTDKVSRKTREDDENLGDALYAQLQNAGDLFVIADEHHVYHEKARAFAGAVRDLNPVALVGLTATPDPADRGKVVFEYTLGEAIADGYVKTPVIVYRPDGTHDERTQLADACQLLRHKETSYTVYRQANPDASVVKPVLFVVCQTIQHAGEVGQVLAGPGFIGEGSQVLEITSQSSDEALQALAAVEESDSPIRAIVSVNMLREGWDVKNIAVIAALRKLASQTLTEQILGRGLRLPFGHRTGVADVDQVDLVAHDSYRQLLAQKDVLTARMQQSPADIVTDPQGAAVETPAGASDDYQGGAERVEPAPQNQQAAPGPAGMSSLLDLDDAEDTPGTSGLGFARTQDRKNTPHPQLRHRVANAPQISFPRREPKLVPAPFQLAAVDDNTARLTGAAFQREVPAVLAREALEAERDGDAVKIRRTRQDRGEGQQTLEGLPMVRTALVEAVMLQPEVPAEKASRNAAKRLVKAFLEGAGVTDAEADVTWGERRLELAVQGMRAMIREQIAHRGQQTVYRFVTKTLPVEPMLVDPSAADARSTTFKKGLQYVGWDRSIMPAATFDAGTTEWELAHLMDGDPGIAWWLRLSVGGDVWVPTTAGRYFPDFIAIDTNGKHWLIEGKSDRDADSRDVLTKKAAAGEWARAVRDEGDYGTWRYMFAAETHIRQAAGSWEALLAATRPEM